MTDADLYTEIVFSGAVLHAPNAPSCQVDPAVLNRLDRRLRRGWFAMSGPPCPQAHYSATCTMPTIQLWAPEDWVGMASKPHGAFWTSSFLPDGTTAWDWGEPKTARGKERQRCRFYCCPELCAVYTIDSLADYTRLVERFPVRTADGRVHADWREVGKSFDAVHLSARGLLHAEGAEAEVLGAPTALKGWEAESTAWLRTPPGAVLRPDAQRSA